MAVIDSEDRPLRPTHQPEGTNLQHTFGPNTNSNPEGSGQGENNSDVRHHSPISPSSQGFDEDRDMNVDMKPRLLLQPEPRPISHDQLVVEVKNFYGALVMVESKCVDFNGKQLNAITMRLFSCRATHIWLTRRFS